LGDLNFLVFLIDLPHGRGSVVTNKHTRRLVILKHMKIADFTDRLWLHQVFQRVFALEE
jgi:hypothetical protein